MYQKRSMKPRADPSRKTKLKTSRLIKKREKNKITKIQKIIKNIMNNYMPTNWTTWKKSVNSQKHNYFPRLSQEETKSEQTDIC